MRRAFFLAFWLTLTLGLAWYPPLNDRFARGDVPSEWTYSGPYTPVRVGTAHPRGSALPVTEPDPTLGPAMRGHIVGGVPTWYCKAHVSPCTVGYPDLPGRNYYAAAGPSLRLGNWRGRVVTVCARVCIRVRLIDWCACGGAHFLDLYWDAWNALGRPSRATVSWQR